MPGLDIRLVGDPVLARRAEPFADIDGGVARLADAMLAAMYDAPGVGLAAPQVGVSRRMFVYDVGDGPQVVVNPAIGGSRGEWVYEEACLSIPGLSFEVVRPDEVHLTGWDLEGREVSIEADEFVGRVFQHEMDHLDGILVLDRLDADERRRALDALARRPTPAAGRA